jgi:DNA-3-methyladenine glycosylase II
MAGTAKNIGTTSYRKARRHLSLCDPVLCRLIDLVGPCTLQPDGDGFRALVRAIVAQLISTKAAASIFARVEAALSEGGLTPAGIVAAGETALRGAGLSGTKARGLLDLANRVLSGELPLDRLPQMSDEEVIDHLVPVHGIGRWTAEMFLIFSLGRLDVLPVDDFGLRAGVRDEYGLPQLPSAKELRALAEPWRPFRSIGTWYFWKSR